MSIQNSSNNPATLESAQVDWRGELPWSPQFDDVYYNLDNGRAESEYVFIQHNQLVDRWKLLDNDHYPVFTIAETGFGTGLNFLTTAQTFLANAPSSARLQFISTELYPLDNADLKRALAPWQPKPDSSDQNHWLGDQLLDNYPPRVAGHHLITMADGRIELLLLLGDALTSLQQLAGQKQVHAWFLDGFTPGKNPSIWQPALYQCMAELSAPGATFSTFSSASEVRRGLLAAGFSTEKAPGFGKKREMLKGQLHSSSPDTNRLEWYLGQSQLAADQSRSAVVIGAGIGGCCAANALARRGYQVTVIDRYDQPAQAGSGNLQAVLYPKLSLRTDQLPEINLASLLFASRYYRRYWQAGHGEQCGVLVLPESDKQLDEFSQIAARHAPAEWIHLAEGEQLHKLSGLVLGSEQALWFERLGWLQPQSLCKALLAHPNIKRICANVTECHYHSADQQWQLREDQLAIASGSQLVLACGIDSDKFCQTGQLPFRPIRGQVTHLSTQQLQSTPRCAVCAEGYIAPAHEQQLTLGASYRHDSSDTELKESEHQHNLELMRRSDPGLEQLLADINPCGLPGRANFRATTPDYLPLVGAVPNIPDMLERFAFLGRDAKQVKPLQGAYHPHLFMLAGLGSRGFSFAPLMSELLASQMEGSIGPLPRELCNALHPARFVIRDLKRNRLQRYAALRSEADLV